MRVTELQRQRVFTQGINDHQSALVRLQEEMATGRSLFKPSENIRKADQALHTEDVLAMDKQYARNIEDGLNWVNAADSKLQSIVDVLNEIDNLALAADNSSQNEHDRRNTAVQIDQKIEDLVKLVNASDGNRYLFGGHGTTTAPFTVIRNADGRIQGVTANEDTIAGKIYRRVGQDEDLQVNVTGDRLFQPVGSDGTDADLFYVVAALRDTIGSNNTPPEGYEETRSNNHLREQLSLIRERIIDQQTYLGSVGQRLQTNQTRLKEREIQLTDALEQAQGVDLTDLVSRAAIEENVYSALAGMGTRLLKQSLVDYLL